MEAVIILAEKEIDLAQMLRLNNDILEATNGDTFKVEYGKLDLFIELYKPEHRPEYKTIRVERDNVEIAILPHVAPYNETYTAVTPGAAAEMLKVLKESCSLESFNGY